LSAVNRRLLALALALACSAGCAKSNVATATAVTAPPAGAVPWLRPDNVQELVQRAGLYLERKETLVYHVHAHLDVFVNGRTVLVPGGIGIVTSDPGVKHGVIAGQPAYGGIALCDKPCISPLHTHDATGLIHTESKTPTPNRLGQFFTEWNVRLDGSCIGGYCRPDSIQVFVNGAKYTSNPADIALTDRKEIAIVIGSPPTKLPSHF
jgi:hypothetical protein